MKRRGALDDAAIRRLPPVLREERIGFGGGLYLLLTPAGGRRWKLDYRFFGRRRTLSVGVFPAMGVAQAEEARDAAHTLLSNWTDPREARRAEQRQKRLDAGQTFRAVAEAWFLNRQVDWSETYRARLRIRLEQNLYPRLGDRPIAAIEPMDVLELIRRIEQRGTIETAKRIMQMAGMVFRYGVATGRCGRDPTQDLRGALRKSPPARRRIAMSAADLPQFLRRLDAYDGEAMTALALKLVVLTFVRTREIRFAAWSEFDDLDGERPLWRIPAERMKMRRAHLVPLAPQAVAVLQAARKLSGRSPYVFPASTRSRVLSENTMLFALYRLGYHTRATVHGFRTTASTILNENEFNRDWIELQLAHLEDSLRPIYNGAEWLQGRRRMMIWWADYLDRARASRS